MADRLRILSIGAHPADIFDQSGGTMVHHVERGDHVGCAVLTHGARVHDAVSITPIVARGRRGKPMDQIAFRQNL